MDSFAFRYLLFGDFSHVRRRRANDPERCGQVHIDHRVPLLICHILNDCIPRVACVVDDDVDSAERLGASLDEAIREIDLGDATGAYHRTAANSGDLISSRLRNVGVDIVDDNRSAVIGEKLCDALSYPATRAGNYR